MQILCKVIMQSLCKQWFYGVRVLVAVQLLTLQPALIFLQFADECLSADVQLYCSYKRTSARVLAWLCARAGVALRACGRSSARVRYNFFEKYVHTVSSVHNKFIISKKIAFFVTKFCAH
jgi:hypothetical protein